MSVLEMAVQDAAETSRRQIEDLLRESGVVLQGHFRLSCGRHSNIYFEKFRILEQPKVLEALCRLIAEHFVGKGIDLVAGPATGGMIVAYEVARLMNGRAVYIENEDGRKTLRRGSVIPSGSRVLVVDDVLTSGLSVREAIDVVRANDATVVGVGMLIDRSEAPIDFACEVFPAFTVEAQSWEPDEVPAWLAAIPIQKPGTRKL
jgi:orotate phosphoribosyltransferase